MQGERNTVSSLPETFEFDLGSASNGSIIVDPQVCWNNVLNGQNLSGYLLSPDQPLPSFEDALNAQNEHLNGWNFENPDSAGLTTVSDNDVNGAKIEHAWMSDEAGPSTTVAGSRLHERMPEVNDTPSIENTVINGTNNQANIELELFHSLYADSMQGLDSNSAPHYSISNVGLVSNSARDPEAGPSNSFRKPDSKQIQNVTGSSNSHITSSGASEHTLEDGESRRLSCKRKNVGGVPVQSSFGAGSSSNQSEGNAMQANPRHYPTSNSTILSPSDNIYGASPAGSMTTRVGTAASGVASDNISSHLGEDTENPQRNLRLRINHAGQHSPSPTSLPASSVSNQNAWYQPLSSLLPPPSHVRPALAVNSQMQQQPHFPIIPGMPQYVPPALVNTPNLRPGGSLTPPVSDRFGALREEINMGSLLRNSPEPPLIIGPSSMHATRQASQIYLGLSGPSMSLQGNMTSPSQLGSTPGSFPWIAPAMVPFRNVSNQHQLSLELIRQSISTAHSNFVSQNNDVHLQRSAQFGSLHTPIPIRGARLRGQQQPQLRFSALMDRQNDTTNSDVSLRAHAARERRTRMLSEIRNMLSALRRGENIRFEDLILEHSVLLGAVDLHDRHRDMRLDVDNMSYEELLALEERIGNVSTGLSEEAVLKCLKQRKHSKSIIEGSPEVEPCCICQEEYVDGEGIGGLDCGHDFHTACITQWLMHKNMCPICKTAALAT